MPQDKHFGQVESLEHLGQSCPIPETELVRVVTATPTCREMNCAPTWLANAWPGTGKRADVRRHRSRPVLVCLTCATASRSGRRFSRISR
jgi:hypothetical protein